MTQSSHLLLRVEKSDCLLWSLNEKIVSLPNFLHSQFFSFGSSFFSLPKGTSIKLDFLPNKIIVELDESKRRLFVSGFHSYRFWIPLAILSLTHSSSFLSSSANRKDNARMKGGEAGKSVPRLIISGAPASGKGTQCEIIKEKCK